MRQHYAGRMERAQTVVERITQLRPVRAWNRYSSVKGAVFAQAMTLSAFLSVFAALFIAFAIFTRFLGDNEELQTTIVTALSRAIPGLIDTGDGGIIDPETLLESSIVGWAGLSAAVVIIFTAIAWIATSRDGIRAVFGLPDPPRNFVLLKLSDLVVAIGLGAVVLVSAGLMVITTNIVQDWLGLSGWTPVIARVGQFILDAAFVLLLLRYGAYIQMRWRSSLTMAILAALVFAILKEFASLLFGGVDRNPLYASIVAVMIVLIWLGFIMQTLLLITAWMAVGKRGSAYQERVLDAARWREEQPELERRRREQREREQQEAEELREQILRRRRTQRALWFTRRR